VRGGSMSNASGRVRSGDVVLAAGSALLLVGLLAHGSSAPAPGPVAQRAGSAEGAITSPAPRDAGSPPGTEGLTEPSASQSPSTSSEPAVFRRNSRTIKTWQDLPVHVVNRPHWLTGRAHRQVANGYEIDAQLRSAEFNLEMMGYDTESIRRGFEMVNRVDAALLEAPAGTEPSDRLLRIARGPAEAAEVAGSIPTDGGEEAVRVRAIALLAGREVTGETLEALRALAKSDPSGPIRIAAGVSLLWLRRQGDVAGWVAGEGSSQAVSDFFDSIRVGMHKLEENRPRNVLIFEPARVVESSPLVDMLMDGSAPAHWTAMTRAKMFGVATWYGGEREDVAGWMEHEYLGSSDDLIRASILFTAPDLTHFRRLEDRAIEVARTGGPGLLVRTALASLGRFRSERSFRALMEVVPNCVDDTAYHAVRALAGLEPRYGKEIEPFLRQLAENHPSRVLRMEADAALKFHFARYPR